MITVNININITVNGKCTNIISSSTFLSSFELPSVKILSLSELLFAGSNYVYRFNKENNQVFVLISYGQQTPLTVQRCFYNAYEIDMYTRKWHLLSGRLKVLAIHP